MDENKVIVSTEMKQVLVNLRNLEEIYVIMSGVTKMPFVLCDEETFDDEVLVYYKPVYNGRECTGSECWYRGGDQGTAGTSCSS